MPEPPKQRWLRLLRRTAKGARGLGERSTADESALWGAHERAIARSRDAGAAAQRIATGAARQRGAVDVVADRARVVASRTGEAQAGIARIVDSFERLGIVALNAGLEGARMGEAEGRQLALVGEEVRGHASRGGDAARALGEAIAQLAAEVAQLEAQAAQAQGVVADVTQESARAAGAASDAEAAIVEVGERVRKATGSDPEAVRAVAEASERARALVASLSALSGKVPRGLLVGALRPVLEPLARILADEEPEASGEADE